MGRNNICEFLDINVYKWTNQYNMVGTAALNWYERVAYQQCLANGFYNFPAWSAGQYPSPTMRVV